MDENTRESSEAESNDSNGADSEDNDEVVGMFGSETDTEDEVQIVVTRLCFDLFICIFFLKFHLGLSFDLFVLNFIEGLIFSFSCVRVICLYMKCQNSSLGVQ